VKPLTITIEDLALDTIVGTQYGEDGSEHMTLADAIVRATVDRLVREPDDRSLNDRITAIRTEEIRTRVVAEIETALTAPVQPTNEFGEPNATPTTLRALIVKAAKDAVTIRSRGSYGEKTPLERVIQDEVDRAITAELSAAVKDEKAKVVAAVRAKAAELIATAVKEGVGR
jgi:hypothetical protein